MINLASQLFFVEEKLQSKSSLQPFLFFVEESNKCWICNGLYAEVDEVRDRDLQGA